MMARSMGMQPRSINRKQFSRDSKLLNALEAYARDIETSPEKWAGVAFGELLKKRHRPVSLHEAPTISARTLPVKDRELNRPHAKT